MKLLDLMYEIQKNPNNSVIIKKSTEKLVEIMHTILAYSGTDAVKIASYIQQSVYQIHLKILNCYALIVF